MKDYNLIAAAFAERALPGVESSMFIRVDSGRIHDFVAFYIHQVGRGEIPCMTHDLEMYGTTELVERPRIDDHQHDRVRFAPGGAAVYWTWTTAGKLGTVDVYICGSDEQILAAAEEYRRQMEEKSANVDVGVLVPWVLDPQRTHWEKGILLQLLNEGRKRYCDFPEEITLPLLAAINSGQEKCRELIEAVAAGEARAEAVRAEAAAEAEEVLRRERKAFAFRKHEELLALGCTPSVAGKIMRAAGPGYCLAAVDWARQALEVIPSKDALDCLLTGAGGTNGFGKIRMEEVLRALKLPVPEVSTSNALFSILRGAAVVILHS